MQIDPGTLTGIATIQQQPAAVAFRTNRLDDGRYMTRPTRGAEALRKISRIKISERMGQRRAPDLIQ